MYINTIRINNVEPPVAVVLGTGDIASAIGLALFGSGLGVVMLRDSSVPVLRRGMAFDDTLECGSGCLDGILGVRVSDPDNLPALARGRSAVVVANFDFAVVAAARPTMATVLVDARMRKYAAAADLRPLAPCTIGIGPGFIGDGNVDFAIETLPGQEGTLVEHGQTATPTGKSVPLGDAADERFVYAACGGPWQPSAELGDWVGSDTVIGQLGSTLVLAPIGGCVRGLVRATSSGVSRGSKLVEIDPRSGAPWTGVPPRAARIADGVRRVIDALLPLRMLP
jgi:xanthine dehydrogenase accessory factor